jgi:transcriptional regulator with XRE-family HTH domain
VKSPKKQRPRGRPKTVQVSEWGRKVEKLADSLQLSRQDLAQRAGLSRPSLWALLVGRSRPKFETVCRLADALGVEVDTLR